MQDSVLGYGGLLTLSQERKDRAVRDYLDTRRSIKAVAKSHGLRTYQMLILLEQYGVTTRVAGKGGIFGKEFSNEEKRLILEFYDQGVTVRQIALDYGCARDKIDAIVQPILDQRERENRARHSLTDDQLSLAIKMYYDGHQVKDIATAVFCYTSWLSAYIRGNKELFKRKEPKREDSTTHDGYVLEYLPKGTPYESMLSKGNGRRILKHRLVMARFLDRPLFYYETVHHKDGNRCNNALENLQLRVGPHGNGQCWQCVNCGSRNIISVSI